MPSITNSRDSRVRPIFTWLRDNGPSDWPKRLLELAGDASANPGPLIQPFTLDPERRVKPSAERLRWMLENRDQLTAIGAKNVKELESRLASGEAVQQALDAADGEPGGKLRLEGSTSADCLITCERMIIWIEGKRTDKLARGTSYDDQRDQVARNLEAAWRVATEEGSKDFRVVICFEDDLDAAETRLVEGYRSGSLTAGLPHVPADVRQQFRDRLLLLRWRTFAQEWPALTALPQLADLEP